jgi:tetratricopeptide (TPR) repeat protein
LAAPLRDLVRKELLALVTDPRSPERGQYGFLQGLLREVAYGTLAKRERRAKHLAAAGYFEALNDEELAGVVATHYAEAHRATPEGPDRDAMAAQAREWLAHGGRRALALGSPEQALAYLEQALALTEDPAKRAALLDLAGDAASRTDAFELAIAHLEAAIAAHRSVGDVDAAGRSTARLAQAVGDGLERVADGIARAELVLVELGATGSERARADLAAILASLRSTSGESEQALAWAETACTLAERLDDTELLGRAIGAKSGVLFRTGRHREAVMLARGRWALAQASGSLVEQADAGVSLSVFLGDDDPHEAMRLALEAAELARRAGARSLETVNLLNAAEAATDLGQWDDARAALSALRQRDLAAPRRTQLELCEAVLAALAGDTALGFELLDATEPAARSEDMTARANNHRARGEVHLAAGDLEAAHRYASAALAAEPSGINGPKALAVQMRSALWLGDAARTREALIAMQSFRGRWMAAVRLTGDAGLAALEQGHDEATTAYARALDAWRALDAPLDLALCALDRALLRGSDPVPEGEDDEAREIFTRLGATPFLDRLERAEAAARKVG